MNTERLLEFLESIRDMESNVPLQKALTDFGNSLQQLSAQPQGGGLQEAVAKSKKILADTFGEYERKLSPAQWAFLTEISSVEFFSSYGFKTIEAQIEQNSMTPAVVHQFVTKFTGDRAKLLQNFEQLRQNLRTIGFTSINLEPGEAELGFQIPRPIFNNQLSVLTLVLWFWHHRSLIKAHKSSCPPRPRTRRQTV